MFSMHTSSQPPVGSAAGTSPNYSPQSVFPCQPREMDAEDVSELNAMCRTPGPFTPHEEEFLLYTKGRGTWVWDINRTVDHHGRQESPLACAVATQNVQKCRFLIGAWGADTQQRLNGMSLHEVCLASARSRQAPVDDTEKIAVYLHSPKKALRDYLQTEKLSEMFTQGVSAFDDSELVASGSLWKDEQHFLRLILGDRYSLADQAGFSAADAGKIEFIDVISWSSKGIIGVCRRIFKLLEYFLHVPEKFLSVMKEVRVTMALIDQLQTNLANFGQDEEELEGEVVLFNMFVTQLLEKLQNDTNEMVLAAPSLESAPSGPSSSLVSERLAYVLDTAVSASHQTKLNIIVFWATKRVELGTQQMTGGEQTFVSLVKREMDREYSSSQAAQALPSAGKGVLEYAKVLLQRQLRAIKRSPLDGASVGLDDEDNLFRWKMVLIGPPDSVYQDGSFNVKLEFPHNFPDNPPEIIFESEIFHPSVDANGKVSVTCLISRVGSVFGDQNGCSFLLVDGIIAALISMLSEPDAESPTNLLAARLWKDDREEFKKRCRQIMRRAEIEAP